MSYTIYFLNDNYQITTKEVPTLNDNILLTENCIVTNIRFGIHFIKEPHKCLQLTDLERLIISTEFWDTEIVKEGDFRRANTHLTANCIIDLPVFDPSNFIFSPNYWRDEGALILDFNHCDSDNLLIYFSPDGVHYNHVFDPAYWKTPEGLAILGLSFIYYRDGDLDSFRIYLDPNFRTDFGNNASTPDLPYLYFESKINGNKSQVYDMTSFFPLPDAIVPDDFAYNMPNLTLYRNGTVINASDLLSPFVELYNIETQVYIDRFPILWSGNTGSIGNLSSGTGVQIRVRTQNLSGVYSYSPYLVIPHA
ncbi:MAG: hypothetical protein ABI441_13745 [Flavobacterium sp.]